MSAPHRLEAYALVQKEIERQDVKWGEQHHHSDFKWLAILSEEVGEAAQAMLDLDSSPDLIPDSHELEAELVQVAAVAIQHIAALRRKRQSFAARPPSFPSPDKLT